MSTIRSTIPSALEQRKYNLSQRTSQAQPSKSLLFGEASQTTKATANQPSMLKKVLKALGLGVGTVVLATNVGCATNKSGQNSVIFNSYTGMKDKVYGEGTSFVWPWEDNIPYDISTQSIQETIINQSKDNIETSIDMNIIWRLDPKELPKIQQNIVGSAHHDDSTSTGHDDIDKYIGNINNRIIYTKIIRPAVRQIVGDKMKQFNAEFMNDNRDEIRNAITDGYNIGDKKIPGLAEKLKPYGIIIEEVAIRRATPPQNLQEVIKQRAETIIKQETAKNQVEVSRQEALAKQEQAKGEALAQQERAKGEAEAIKIRGQALRENPQILELNRVEAYKAAGEKGSAIIILDSKSANPNVFIQPKSDK